MSLESISAFLSAQGDAGFEPIALVELEPGHWSIRSPNYTVVAQVV